MIQAIQAIYVQIALLFEEIRAYNRTQIIDHELFKNMSCNLIYIYVNVEPLVFRTINFLILYILINYS